VHEVIQGSVLRLRMFYSMEKDSLALGLPKTTGMGETTGFRFGESTHRPYGQALIQLGYGTLQVKYSPMSCVSSSLPVAMRSHCKDFPSKLNLCSVATF